MCVHERSHLANWQELLKLKQAIVQFHQTVHDPAILLPWKSELQPLLDGRIVPQRGIGHCGEEGVLCAR